MSVLGRPGLVVTTPHLHLALSNNQLTLCRSRFFLQAARAQESTYASLLFSITYERKRGGGQCPAAGSEVHPAAPIPDRRSLHSSRLFARTGEDSVGITAGVNDAEGWSTVFRGAGTSRGLHPVSGAAAIITAGADARVNNFHPKTTPEGVLYPGRCRMKRALYQGTSLLVPLGLAIGVRLPSRPGKERIGGRSERSSLSTSNIKRPNAGC